MPRQSKQTESKKALLVPQEQPSEKSEVAKDGSKKKIEPWPVKDLNSKFKLVNDMYETISNLHTLPTNNFHVDELKLKVKEQKEKLDQFKKLYKETYEQVETKRETKLKPRVCDIKLTKLFQSHFQKALPEMGKYGVCDLNRLAPRAISIYVKENNLTFKNYFKLDSALMNLFGGPSVENPSKTYLQLGKERIEELRLKPDYEHSPSSADIREDSGIVSMNYSALKIITPKFGVDYKLDDVSKYMNSQEDFAKHLEDLHNKQEVDKKEANKKKKAKV